MKTVYRAMTLIVLGFVFAVSSGFSYAQGVPNRALTIPRPDTVPGRASRDYPSPAPNIPGEYPLQLDAQCSNLLEREKELTALLKKKIEILEQRLAQAGDLRK